LFTSPTGVNNTLGLLSTRQFAAPGFTNLQATKESSDFGAKVTTAKGDFTFSDLLNIFLFSERYDIGVMTRAPRSATAACGFVRCARGGSPRVSPSRISLRITARKPASSRGARFRCRWC